MPNSLPVRLNEGEHLLAPQRVQAGRRLVQQDHYGVVYQGLRQLHTLLHACGVLADRPVALLVEPDVPQRVRRACPGVGRRESAYLGHVRQELRRSQRQGEAVVLRHVAEPGADLYRLVRPLSQHLGRAGGGLDESQEQLDGRALARAVRPKQSRDALANLEVNPIEGDDRAIVLRQRLRFQQERHATSITPAAGSCPDAGPTSQPLTS